MLSSTDCIAGRCQRCGHCGDEPYIVGPHFFGESRRALSWPRVTIVAYAESRGHWAWLFATTQVKAATRKHVNDTEMP